MTSGNYEFQSDFAKKCLAKGEAKGRAAALLDARGLRASDEARGRILACTDPAQLDAWVRNRQHRRLARNEAVSVASVDDLF